MGAHRTAPPELGHDLSSGMGRRLRGIDERSSVARHKPTAKHARRRQRRLPRAALIAAPLALVVTGTAVGLGVRGAEVALPDTSAIEAPRARVAAIREPVVSRNQRREARRVDGAGTPQTAAARPSMADKMMRRPTVRRAINAAAATQWTTTELNIWTRPDAKAEQVGLLDAAVKVTLTGRELLGRQEIVLDGTSRWVTAGYLSAEKPSPEPGLGGQCSNGTSVPSGVSSNIRAIHQAVCANFPEIVSYGTLRSDGEHAQGIAMDIMVSGDRGWEVAEFIRSFYSELGVNYVIHARSIWSVQRSAEGWRAMGDRGSVTANHYDHVHVTTY
jgi:hypothetical protein